MIRLALILAVVAGPASAELIHGLSPCDASKTGDQVILEMGEVFPQVRYSNASDRTSCKGYYEREGFGIKLRVFVKVSTDETVWVEVEDRAAIPEVLDIEVPDGEEGVIRLLPAMF